MTIQHNVPQDDSRVRRSWREHVILPMLVAGGVLTLTWIVVLIAVVFQILGAIGGPGAQG